ncbi:MAG: hypothetical protein M1821_003822 [Bathelium mastoideum]|nr:MAG: hypothetical protein M1821_003822 [Bathelium mastoideum]
MDGLSVAASVISVLQLSSGLIKYLKDVTNAPKDCQQCASEASNLCSLLIDLLYHLKQKKADDTWYTTIQALDVENGPLDQYKRSLVLLQSKVGNCDGMHQLKRRLLWRFNKEDIANILVRMERLKTLVNIAMEMDHMQVKLSRAIKDDTTSIQAGLISLKTSTTATEAGINTVRSETRRVQDDTGSIRDALPLLQSSTTDIRNSQSQQHHQSAMEWLSSVDFPAQQHDIISRKAKGTGQWFLDSPKFQDWLQGPNKILFCPGIPGAGKTMMAAVIIEYLCQAACNDDTGIAYLFCSYKTNLDQSIPNLLAALLKQLIQGRPNIAAPATHMYEYHFKRGSRPSVQELLQNLNSVFSRFSNVFIIIDALDEYSSINDERRQLINMMRDLQAGSNVRLLFTSRFIPDVIQDFCSCPHLEIRADQGDIKRFVASQLSRLPACIQRDDELKTAVQTNIVEAVDGMFLLARLYVDSLLDKRTKHRVLSTLYSLSKGSAALDDAYHDAITRINGQLDEDRSLAKRIICWISYAQRLLTTEELCCALAVEPGDKILNVDNIGDVKEIVSLCAGLVTIDEESNIVRLTHHTTQEYFERVRLEWSPNAQEEIAIICLTYLSFDTFKSGGCAGNSTFSQRLSENPFFDYLAHYWSEHIRPVQRSDRTSKLALAFLRNNALTESVIQVPWETRFCYHDPFFPRQINGLHLTACYGLSYLTERLLKEKDGDSDNDVDAKDIFGQTPLSWAACHGHKTVVKLLLETEEVDIESKDTNSQTPLWKAARNGHEEVVKLLLETGKVEIDSQGSYGWTPLSNAAYYGYEKIVKLLLETGKVDIDLKDRYGWTPLLDAAYNGHEKVVELLLETGRVDINSKERYGSTPLMNAACNGHEQVVKLLLETGKVDIDPKDSYGSTPLLYAVYKGHEEVVKLLLKTGKMDIDHKNGYGSMLLCVAMYQRHEKVVKLLLEIGKVDISLKDSNSPTPLLDPADIRHERVVKLLLERGADIDLKDMDGSMPLSYTASKEHERVVKLLLERGAGVDSKDIDGSTPLSYAVSKEHERIVKLLLKRGADVNLKDINGSTPLLEAVSNGHERVVKLMQAFNT